MIEPELEVLVVRLREGQGLSLPSPLQISDNQLLPYAVLNFSESKGFICAISGTTGSPVWEHEEMRIACERDGLESTDFTVQFYIRDPRTSQGTRDIPLGFIIMDILLLLHRPQTSSEWLQVQGGTGQIRLDISYTGGTRAQIGEHPQLNIWKFGHEFKEDLLTRREASESIKKNYDCQRIWKRNISPRLDFIRPLLSQPISPFIAPLKFVAENHDEIHLFSPFFQGGPLFYYLQRDRRFDLARSRFYAAEIVCALGCLHEFDPSYQHLKPKHIHLDALGHIAICDFPLFDLEEENTNRFTRPILECPAPETLSGEGPTDAVKWWTLGVFLYDMLTGLPPFYHENAEEMYQRILSEPPYIPESLPSSAKNIIIKLLSLQPETRLGAKGVSEVQAHPFFNGINWAKVIRREYEPSFRPPEFSQYFKNPVWFIPRPQPAAEELFRGFSYVQPSVDLGIAFPSRSMMKLPPSPVTTSSPASVTVTPHFLVAVPSTLSVIVSPPPLIVTNTLPPLEVSQTANDELTNWELVWEQADRLFYFYNHITKSKQPILNNYIWDLTQSTREMYQAPAILGTSAPLVDDKPSEAYKYAVLMEMLKKDYLHLIPEFLREYKPTLNPPFHTREGPLQSVIKREDIALVKLFLENGADVNPNISEASREWPLRIAVAKKNQELVRLLVPKTKRAPGTRALSDSVHHEDTVIVKILLANSVQCDFEESDQEKPPIEPLKTLNGGCTFTGLEPDINETVSPLIAAVLSCNIELAKLLLTHNANSNVGYHDLGSLRSSYSLRLNVNCGRAVELAMELECHNMVQLLLDAGANIDLPQPVWVHQCDMVPRTEYLKITARLRAVVAERKLVRGQGES